MNFTEFLQQLATCEGTVSVIDGVVTFADGSSFDLNDSAATVVELTDAFSLLMVDVESFVCCAAAYGYPVENEQHPFHESVLRARTARKRFAALMSKPRKLWWIADDKAEADRWSAELTEKGAKIVKIQPHPAPSTQIDVVFSLDPAKAVEILGRVPDEEEWLEDDAVGAKE